MGGKLPLASTSCARSATQKSDPAVTDHDVHAAMGAAGPMAAFAVAERDVAARAREWEIELPAIAALPHQPVGEERQLHAGGAKDVADQPIHAVGENDDLQIPAPAHIDETWKLRIDL